MRPSDNQGAAIAYLDFAADMCHLVAGTMVVFPKRQLEPSQGEPAIGSFLSGSA